jgi:glycerol uptake facilitator-like aquaporin
MSNSSFLNEAIYNGAFKGLCTAAVLLLNYLRWPAAGQAFLIPALVWTLIVKLAYPSKQHLNSGFSLAMYLSGSIGVVEAIMRIAGQLVGTVAAMISLRQVAMLLGLRRLLGVSMVGVPKGGSDANHTQMVEFVGSAAAYFFILCSMRWWKPADQPVIVATFVVAWQAFTKVQLDPSGVLCGAVLTGQGYDRLFRTYWAAQAAGATVAGCTYGLLTADFWAPREKAKRD